MDSPKFPLFLDQIEQKMKAKPTDSQDGVDLDHSQIEADLQRFHNFHTHLSMRDRLYHFIRDKQSHITTGLTVERLQGFEAFPRHQQLMDMATHGLRTVLKPGFTPNQGVGDFRRETQLARLRHTIAQHVRKLQDRGHCFVIPLVEIQGTEGFHLSALHVAIKAMDSKGRPCVDLTHSGLNEATDMDTLTASLGEFQLPHLRRLAKMLAAAERQGHRLMHKTDVTAAFNNMLLSPEAALLQTFQVGDLVIIPLVAGFGWCAAPAYYNVIANAIDWAHNGGVTDQQLDEWAVTIGVTPKVRNAEKEERSLTYVDDSCGASGAITAPGDMADLQAIISTLLGPEAYNVKKTEGPAEVITIIGWECNLQRYTIRPSRKGQEKLYYWIFRGLGPAHLGLHELRRAVGTLRWYSAVVPMASTFELQRLLAATECEHAAKRSARQVFVKVTAPARREIEWWRGLLTANLSHDLLAAPIRYLNKTSLHRPRAELYAEGTLSLVTRSDSFDGTKPRRHSTAALVQQTLTVWSLSQRSAPS